MFQNAEYNSNEPLDNYINSPITPFITVGTNYNCETFSRHIISLTLNTDSFQGTGTKLLNNSTQHMELKNYWNLLFFLFHYNFL